MFLKVKEDPSLFFSIMLIPSALDKSNLSLPGPEKSILFMTMLTSTFSPAEISFGPVCVMTISSILKKPLNTSSVKFMKIRKGFSI